MAKKEQSVKTTTSKKSKAKKRKHTATESNDDEVANKSLIVDQEPDVITPVQSGVNLKRKQKLKSTIKEKRSKLSNEERTETDVDDDEANNDDELHEPTLEELRESEKPENTNAVLTIRQKKKQKHLERMAAQKQQSGGKEQQRNAAYLQKWKHARTDWKFEKLRQISIQQTMFDETKVDQKIWPIALEYLSGSKGTAKEKLTKIAEQVIDELDKKCGDLEDDAAALQSILDSTRYQRARELLQSFD